MKKRDLCRIIDQFTILVKTGTVAGTVKAFLIRIPCNAASHMRTFPVLFTE